MNPSLFDHAVVLSHPAVAGAQAWLRELSDRLTGLLSGRLRRGSTLPVPAPQYGPSLNAVVSRTCQQAATLNQGGPAAATALALQRFGARVARARRARGWTRLQAARNLGVDEQRLAWVEWGLLQPEELDSDRTWLAGLITDPGSETRARLKRQQTETAGNRSATSPYGPG